MARADDRPIVGEPIPAGSSSHFTAELQDLTGTGQTARDVLCWVEDRDTTKLLYGPFAVTPAVPMVVTLPPAANQAVDPTKDLEWHVVTCQARAPAACVPVPTPGSTCDTPTGGFLYAVIGERIVVGGSTPGPSPAPTPTVP